MELRKESMQMLQIKSRAASQVTFDTDYNVPDAKPDVGRLMQNKGDVSMDEVRLSEGRHYQRKPERGYSLCGGRKPEGEQSGANCLLMRL